MEATSKALPRLLTDGSRWETKLSANSPRMLNNKGQALMRIVMETTGQLNALLSAESLPGDSTRGDIRPWQMPVMVGHLSLLSPVKSIKDLTQLITLSLTPQP